MIISLIGMSNVGKSFWSRRLQEEHMFQHICCDDLIAQILQVSTKETAAVTDLASWMGMPHSEGFVERETQYLEAEARVLTHILDTVEVKQNVVIDTTGSVIYLAREVLDQLQNMSRVVYLQTADEDLNTMIETFFDCPKPVIWRDVFHRLVNEQEDQALRRCYPTLLKHRAERYQALAHISIPRHRLRDPHYSTDQFLYEVLQHK